MKEFEYLLVMQTKLWKKKYVDFIRDITPVFFSFSEKVLEKYCNLRFSDIGECRNDNWYLAIEKLKKREIDPKPNWGNYTNISSTNILYIMKKICQDKNLVELMDLLFELAAYAGLNVSGYNRRIYGVMNEKLIKLLY